MAVIERIDIDRRRETRFKIRATIAINDEGALVVGDEKKIEELRHFLEKPGSYRLKSGFWAPFLDIGGVYVEEPDGFVLNLQTYVLVEKYKPVKIIPTSARELKLKISA